ncbi:hypothetical protein [Gluconobacter sp. Dm-44]|nr:hypothetical protein [Gluconobacter sp. Dm-44]
MMPELDTFDRSTGFQQGEQTGRAVLAARHGDNDAVIGREIRAHEVH